VPSPPDPRAAAPPAVAVEALVWCPNHGSGGARGRAVQTAPGGPVSGVGRTGMQMQDLMLRGGSGGHAGAPSSVLAARPWRKDGATGPASGGTA
jgi:hypothetical protein